MIKLKNKTTGEDLTFELTKVLEDYPNYRVTFDGKILNKSGKALKPFITYQGYEMISLCKNNIAKKFPIHRIVAKYFVTNLENKPWVNHKDGNKTNNHFLNLEWCTPSENNLHSFSIGTNKPRRGEKNHSTKLSDLEVIEIRKLLASGMFYKQIAKKFNISTSVIGQIKRGKRKTTNND